MAIPAISRHFRTTFDQAKNLTARPDTWKHIGIICDVITRHELAGIPGAELALALERDTQDRGWTWPDRIKSPAAFLHRRFASMDLTDLRTAHTA